MDFLKEFIIKKDFEIYHYKIKKNDKIVILDCYTFVLTREINERVGVFEPPVIMTQRINISQYFNLDSTESSETMFNRFKDYI